MRVLTVRQPWAWAIIHGGKNVENRTRNIAGSYRGPVAIHAGLSLAPAHEWSDELHRALEATNANLQLGAVIGRVDLWAAHRARPTCTPNADPDEAPPGCDSPWAMPGHWHLMLGGARPLATPIPAKGRLGLWRPDAALLAELAEQGVA